MQIIYLNLYLCKGFLCYQKSDENASVKNLKFSFLTRHNLHNILYLQ